MDKQETAEWLGEKFHERIVRNDTDCPFVFINSRCEKKEKDDSYCYRCVAVKKKLFANDLQLTKDIFSMDVDMLKEIVKIVKEQDIKETYWS